MNYSDQAETLRILVSSCDLTGKRESSTAGAPWIIPHKLIVVAGGLEAVGATTIARNLAHGANLNGIRTEYVRPGPTDKTVPGIADYYVVDAGSTSETLSLADYIVLITTPEDESVKQVYSMLKRLRRTDPDTPVGLIVNNASKAGEGVILAERIASVAKTFIRGKELEVLGWINRFVDSDNAENAEPIITRRPCSAAAVSFRRCVKILWSRWQPRWSVVAA